MSARNASSVKRKHRATRSTSARKRSCSTGACDDPRTVVAVPPPSDGQWCLSLRGPREAGELIDITLIVGGRKIPAHKIVLVSMSPYLRGLLASGLAESKQASAELKIGDGMDPHAVEAIVDCFYSGELAMSQETVSSVLRTANKLVVSAVEKAACDFFVDSLDGGTACEALEFAAAHAACGEHAHRLHERCLSYLVDHFSICSAEPSFLNLSGEVVAKVVGSDELPVEEAMVLTAVRAWFDHDAVGRKSSLTTLVPLIRWPLLSRRARQKLRDEPLLRELLKLDDRGLSLGMDLLLECNSHDFAKRLGEGCLRHKLRKGSKPTLQELRFSAIDEEYYSTSEEGALLIADACPDDRPALCNRCVMHSGESCAEITVVQNTGHIMVGVVRPDLDPEGDQPYTTDAFWGVDSASGDLYHNAEDYTDGGDRWEGQQPFGKEGDVLRLLLDLNAGTLTIQKNGEVLGTPVASDLTGPLCWAVTGHLDYDDPGDWSVRIKSMDPGEF